MKKNNDWISIVIWMLLTILMLLAAYVILSYIIPFMKSSKWIENASMSYYIAYSWIEEGLYHIKTRPDIVTESWSNMPLTATWFSFQTYSSWHTIPIATYWNSEYSSWHNIISQIEPIQLKVWNSYISDFDNLSFEFKIPNFTNQSFIWSYPIINWLLTSESDTLYATENTLITTTNLSNFEIWNKNWFKLNDWEDQSFKDFYISNCWTNSWCTLKMSVVNDLVLTDLTTIPYLEYKLDFGSDNLPDRYSRIESFWKSYGYQKKLDVRVPQQTINQAFDFTVFQ